MATLPDHAVAKSLDQTNQRLASARQRRLTQQRLVVALAAALVIVVWLVVVLHRSSRSAPRIVLTWPPRLDRQILAPGESVLVRPGQPWVVSVDQPQSWNVRWSGGSVQAFGAAYSWSPSGNPATLLAYCRPAGTGWHRLVTWLYPPVEVRLQGVEAAPLDGMRRRLRSGLGTVWLFPHILAPAAVDWDERALPLLVYAAENLPRRSLHGVRGEFWRLMPSFDGPAAPGDIGTYALLDAGNLEDSLTKCARLIASKSPGASIKFVVRLDAPRPYGIMRIAFDGKGQHAAWIRAAGQTAGGPLQWDETAPADRLSPQTPGRMGR